MLRIPLLLICAAVTACAGDQAPLVVEDLVLTRPIPGSAMGAGYFTMRNTSKELIRIDKVDSPDFAAVAMHESILEDGIARMVELPEILLPPQSSIVFAAGGKHLMLRYSATTPEVVTLQFFAGAAMLLSVQVNTAE